MCGWVRWGMGKYTKRHTDVETDRPLDITFIRKLL